MELEKILGCLGKPESSQELLDTLSRVGINLSQELKLPKGQFDAHIERPSEGFSLIFTDEAMFLGIGDQPLGKGPLYLTGVFLYAEGKDGYTQFSGNIPKNLTFGSRREEIINQLGDPSWQRKRRDGTIAADRWDEVVDYNIHVTYSKSKNTPTVIGLGKPDKPLPVAGGD